MRSSKLLRLMILAVSILIGGALTAPERVEASPASADHSSLCKKKKKKTKKRRVKRRRSTRKRLVTARTIKRWQRKGYKNDKIVRLAKKKGYKLTKKEQARLRRYKVRKSLRKDLHAALIAPPPAPKPTGPQPIDIEKTIDPNEIDFDSVAPPEGMDMRFADQHRQEAEAKK